MGFEIICGVWIYNELLFRCNVFFFLFVKRWRYKMSIYKFDLNILKLLLIVIYDSCNKCWDEEVYFIELCDSINKLIFVNVFEVGVKLGDGVIVDVLKMYIFVCDVVGKVVFDFDVVYVVY